MGRAGIYVRVSVDRDGRSESPQRQLADCRALAARDGLEVAEVYEDRDQSAYSKKARRPEYRRMLKDLKDGAIDSVVFWKLDRLTRQGTTGFNEVYLAVEAAGGGLYSVIENLDTSTPMGRGVAGILASVAEQESFNTSTRVKRQHVDAAANGKMHTGLRGYGYTSAGEIVPKEADVMREAARRVLEGASFSAVAADLNERGVPTATGGLWYSSTLANLLRSPRLAGFRTHNGETHEGAWEPILSAEEHRRLVATKTELRADRQRNLLAGIVRCGTCDGPMKVHGQERSYACVKSPGNKNCGKVGASRRSVEAHVVDSLLRVLSAGSVVPGDESVGLSDRDIRRLIEEDQAALLDLSRARFKDRTMPQAEYLTLRAEMDERVAEYEEELEKRAEVRRRVESAPGLRPGSREDLDAWWAAATDPEKYDAIHAAVERVTIKPAVRFGSKFDKGRVEVDLDSSLLDRVMGTGSADSWLSISEAVRPTG